MKLFVGGSLTISRLHPEAAWFLRKTLENKDQVLVGDAPGADDAVQRFLHGLRYQHVTVFYSGIGIRNNRGLWKTMWVDSGLKSKGHAMHGAKDRAMAKLADEGLMLWDGRTVGTVANALDLVRQEKPCAMVLANGDGKGWTVTDREHLREMCSQSPGLFEDATARLDRHDKRMARLQRASEPTLFD